MSLQSKQKLSIKQPKVIAKRVYNAAGKHLESHLKRDHKILIRLTVNEYQALQKSLDKSNKQANLNISMSEFSRSIVNSYAPDTTYENSITALINYKDQMRQIGQLVNQIAAGANAKTVDVLSKEVSLNLIKNLKAFYKLTEQLPLEGIEQIAVNENVLPHKDDEENKKDQADYIKSKYIQMRFNDVELNLIADAFDRNKKKSGLDYSIAHFVRSIVINSIPEIYTRQTNAEYLALAYQLSAFSNNLNQIKEHVNLNTTANNRGEDISKALARCIDKFMGVSHLIRGRLIV